jgi:hypothetical protein
MSPFLLFFFFSNQRLNDGLGLLGIASLERFADECDDGQAALWSS